MSGNVEWASKTPSETVVRYADFTDELAVGETLSNVGLIASVWSGNDPSPQSIAVSSVVINNAFGVPAVGQLTVQAGVQGTLYQCLISALTSLGHIITKTAVLAVKPPLT